MRNCVKKTLSNQVLSMLVLLAVGAAAVVPMPIHAKAAASTLAPMATIIVSGKVTRVSKIL